MVSANIKITVTINIGGYGMAVRYRKSINLGGGFRINVSKSGVSYSWGTKGYRITKTAKGTIRQTATIPGTGISFVDESGKKKKKTPNQSTKPSINPPSYDEMTRQIANQNTEEFLNSSASEIVSSGLEEILSAAKRVLLTNKIANIGMCISFFLAASYDPFILIFCLLLILKIYVKTKGQINLDYTIDDDQREIVADRINPMIKVTQSNRVWRIMKSSKVTNQKYNSGAESAVDRVDCTATQKMPFPFKTNTSVASFKAGKETLVFLPDKLLILQGKEIGALNYNDISTSVHIARFIEEGIVPKDAEIADYTWKYVNKSGGPDKRFKDNKQIPICLYGEIELKSTSGLNTVIMFSNINLK